MSQPPMKNMDRMELVKIAGFSAAITAFAVLGAAAGMAAGPEVTYFEPGQTVGLGRLMN